MSPSGASSFRSLFSALLVATAVSNLGVRGTVYSSCVNSNDIALTFDDGPWTNLRSISDHFTAAGAKATFFWNGNNYDCIYNSDRMSDMKYAYAAGHQVGSHTWSHPELTSMTSAQITDQLFRMDEAFSRILGIRVAFLRPPYGDYDDTVTSVASARGQNLALWDQDTEDADGATVSFSESVYNAVANDKLKNALILEHETEDTTASTLVPFAIKLFQSKGYNLVTLAECVGVNPYQVVGVPQTVSSSWTCDNTPYGDTICGGSIPCESGIPAVQTSGGSSGGGGGTTTTNQYIHPSANSAKCLAAASNSSGAVVEIEDCATSSSQAWTINTAGTISIYGNKCLDVTGGSTTSGTKLQIWTCTSADANQQWTVTGKAIQWTGTSQCVDLTDGSQTDGSQTQIWACSGDANQQWTFTTGNGTTGTGGTGTGGTGTGGTGGTGNTIRPNASGTTCLTALSQTNGSAVAVEPCTSGAANQQWTVNGQTILAYGSYCLDVTGGADVDGTKLQIWKCTPGHGDAAQHWTIGSDKTIQWVNEAKCLDLTGGSLTAGSQAQVWDCSTSGTPYANQIWNRV